MEFNKINKDLFIKIQGIFKADGEDFIGLGSEIAIPVIEENEKYVIDRNSDNYVSVLDYLSSYKVEIPSELELVFVNDGKIYQDVELTIELEGNPNVIYIDQLGNTLYRFNGESLIQIGGANYKIDYEDLINKPTKLSQFENDEGFIGKTELQNYYKVSDADQKFASKDFVNEQITRIFKVRGSLDTIDQLEHIKNPSNGDVYFVKETSLNYVYVGGGWESLGSTFDLSDYLTAKETEAKLRQIQTDLDEHIEAAGENFIKTSGGVVTGELTVQKPTEGGHAANKEFVEEFVDKEIQKVLEDFEITNYPSFTDPSAKISKVEFEGLVSRNFSETVDIEFDRGTITPDYGTNGFRSGELEGVEIDDGGSLVLQEGKLTIFIGDLNLGENNFEIKIHYGEGEQPKDSKGHDFGEALPAGFITIPIKIFAHEDCYVNGVLQPASSYNSNEKYIEVILPAESSEKQQISLVETCKLIGIKQFNEFTDTWTWIFGDQTKSLESFEKEIIETSNYYLYKNKLPRMGERRVRFYYEEEKVGEVDVSN